MRRKSLVVAVISAVGFSFAASVAAQQDLRFTVKGQNRLPDADDCGALLCSEADIDGFGTASYTLLPVSFEPNSRSCADYTALVEVVLDDGSGTATLEEVGEVCFPGNSFNAPGTDRSFGNPFTTAGTFEVVEATGSLSGTVGDTGSASVGAAGAAAQGTYD